MLREQKDCRIPSCQVPKCPVCGGDMEVHLRCDGNFVRMRRGTGQRYGMKHFCAIIRKKHWFSWN